MAAKTIDQAGLESCLTEGDLQSLQLLAEATKMLINCNLFVPIFIEDFQTIKPEDIIEKYKEIQSTCERLTELDDPFYTTTYHAYLREQLNYADTQLSIWLFGRLNGKEYLQEFLALHYSEVIKKADELKVKTPCLSLWKAVNEQNQTHQKLDQLLKTLSHGYLIHNNLEDIRV